MLIPLKDKELESVSGGTSYAPPPGYYGDGDYWAEELLRYKLGLSSRFGPGE